MLIHLEGDGPVMWQGWGADSESPVYRMLPSDGESLLESAIEHFETLEYLEPSIFSVDAVIFNRSILTLQDALRRVQEEARQ